MIQLCMPLTDIFRRNRERLLPLVGAVSFKEPTEESFPGKEQMLECSLNIADPLFPEKLQGAGLLTGLRSGRFTSFACDLGPAWASFLEDGRSPNGYPRYLPGSHPMDEQEYIEQAQRNVDLVRTHFSGKIKVENLNYFPTGAYELVCEPDFIARTLRHLGIELLLDTGHLTISVHNLGIPLEEYLDRLPLERVSEVQLSRPDVVNGIWEDTHELPSEEELATLERVLPRAPVQYITLEYYKDDQRLIEGYQHLAEWLRQVEKIPQP